MTRRILGAAVTTLIVVAAVALACWFVFSWSVGATLITFRTGSMAPAMPQGTLAVSVPVQAVDIKVGDVITVPRPSDGQPVTHRVVEVHTPEEAASLDPLTEDQREFVLKGDDNDQVDMRPYVISEARIVTFAMPGFGATLLLVQSPLGMGVLVLIAGSLTIWAFWPRRESADAEGVAEETADGAGDEAADTAATHDQVGTGNADPHPAPASCAPLTSRIEHDQQVNR